MIATYCLAGLVVSVLLVVIMAMLAFLNVMVAAIKKASEPDLEFKVTHILAITPGSTMEVMVAEGFVFYLPVNYDEMLGLGPVEAFPGKLFPVED